MRDTHLKLCCGSLKRVFRLYKMHLFTDLVYFFFDTSHAGGALTTVIASLLSLLFLHLLFDPSLFPAWGTFRRLAWPDDRRGWLVDGSHLEFDVGAVWIRMG